MVDRLTSSRIKKIFTDLNLTELLSVAVLPGAWAEQSLESTASESFAKYSPIDGQFLADCGVGTRHYDQVVSGSVEAFKYWRSVPAPVRGNFVRHVADELRRNKFLLGELVSIETGKILSEGEGEIQEAIDIADFAVGLSRQLYGLEMHSERFEHRMFEQWHPLGVIGVITAFNFPVGVWAWNAMIALVCGNSVLWKPSEHTPLSAIACISLVQKITRGLGHPLAITSLLLGKGSSEGQLIANDLRIPCVSATGSCIMGKDVATRVASRFGRSILELGGNNAVIIMEDAHIDMAIRSTLFGALGTSGQRCTTTRRLLVHHLVYERVKSHLVDMFSKVKVGNPLTDGVIMGPLISENAVNKFISACKNATEQGGTILFGGNLVKEMPSALYVEPTLIEISPIAPIVHEETFAPILYISSFTTLKEAIALNNGVDQGLSSAIFTNSLVCSEYFLSSVGSDCGIANVNLGTSGAEIGGAFGGEKHTGGGREAGSDSWKYYMRRQTSTINYGATAILAQKVNWEVT